METTRYTQALKVPRIIFDAGMAKSDSECLVAVPDTCACWLGASMDRCRDALLNPAHDIICTDATAYVAVFSLAIEMLCEGLDVRTEVVRGWE